MGIVRVAANATLTFVALAVVVLRHALRWYGTRAWLRRVRERRIAHAERFAAARGVTLDEYLAVLNARVQTWLAEPDVRIRVPRDLLAAVISSGRIRNQFETGTSRGALSPPLRVQLEQAMFGLPPRTPAVLRPKYGYLAGTDPSAVRHYGSVVLRLNARILKRTTATFGDSLDDTVQGTEARLSPVPLVRPSIEALYTDVDLLSYGRMCDATSGGYVEAQIHGIVRISDIAEVVLTDGGVPDPATAAALAAAGVPWRTVNGNEP